MLVWKDLANTPLFRITSDVLCETYRDITGEMWFEILEEIPDDIHCGLRQLLLLL